MSRTAAQAINESIADKTTAVIEYPTGGEGFRAAADALSAQCADSTSYAGPEEDGTYIYEYSGKTQAGAEWSVRLVGPRTV